jgi:membrane protease subunit HflC
MKKWVLIGILVIFLAVVAWNSFYVVEENEYGCVFRFSEIVDTASDPGLHFKIPFVDSVQYFSKATQFYDIPPSEVLTSDKQNMTVDCYILWRIEDPQQFYRALGTNVKAEERLNAITYNALKTAMGTLAQADIINMNDGAERNEIYESIAANVDAQAKEKGYGIHVEDVKIKQFDLPDSNLNAVYQRMISERNQMAAKHTADGDQEAKLIRNEVEKDVGIIVSNAKAEAAQLVAEGEAEYMRLLAEAYDTPEKREFYEFTLALDALKASLNGDEKTIILDENSELGKILIGAK